MLNLRDIFSSSSHLPQARRRSQRTQANAPGDAVVEHPCSVLYQYPIRGTSPELMHSHPAIASCANESLTQPSNLQPATTRRKRSETASPWSSLMTPEKGKARETSPRALVTGTSPRREPKVWREKGGRRIGVKQGRQRMLRTTDKRMNG